MPPKRKIKPTTKAAGVAPQPHPQPKAKPAGAIRTSSSKRTSTSVQGLRTSRLQPTEPLHMTTRGAAKAASNHTSPAAPSSIAGSSRRSSLNDIAHIEDHSDVEDARQPKRSRVSTHSGSPPDFTGSFISQIPAVESQTTDQQMPENEAMSSAPKASAKKRRASVDSSGSSKTVSARPNGVLARSESDVSDKQPRRKKRKTAETLPDPADAPPELTDASTPPGSPEPIPEVASSQGLQNVLPTTNGEAPAKAAKRLPGRRRQPHSDINVETDLRRQLNIKMSYRTVAKAQKQILEELASRTIKGVEDDPQFHKQGPEYEHVMAQLQERRDGRFHRIQAERQLKLDQLERVRTAEEHIQKEQFLNRFEELREDLLLQCYYQFKQIQRQARRESGDGTDDEEHIIEPTRVDFPVYNADDRLGSKYASRSRAYVETERMLGEEDLRKDLDQQRKAFLSESEGFDDSIEAMPSGFAKFIGPDRAEAIAHFNVASLANAAAELEKTPPPPEPLKIIANEEADALFALATLSAQQEALTVIKSEQSEKDMEIDEKEEKKNEALTQSNGIYKTHSPPTYPPTPPAATSPAKHPKPKDSPALKVPSPIQPTETSRQEEQKGQAQREPEATSKPAPARTTHRIMDMLNNDDVPVHKPRETQQSFRDRILSSNTIDAVIQRDETSKRLESGPTNADDTVLPPIGSPSRSDQFWPSRNMNAPNDYARDTRDPLMRIKNMLHARDERAKPQGQTESSSLDRPEAPAARRDSDPSMRIRHMLSAKESQEERTRFKDVTESHAMDRSESSASRHESENATGPLLARPFSPHDSTEPNRESRRMSHGGYSASPSTAPATFARSPSSAPMTYAQSPRERHAPYPHPPRHSSYDQTPRSSWEDNNRRLSGSQGPPPSHPSGSQYAGSPPQTYPSLDYKKSGPTPPSHQSPYPPPPNGSTQLPPPSSNNSLPAKQPAAPAPINFRFAHYDPAPSQVRSPYNQPAQHAPYSPVSHTPAPASAPSTPSQHSVPYSTAPPFPGYVPPAGSFQAPPPPPSSQQQQNSSQFPPLKIHQYGGQPILPANMAPPQGQSSSQGSPQPYSHPPSPHVSGYAQPQSQPQQQQQQSQQAQQQPSIPLYEHGAAPPAPPQERPDPQPRPRRAYRSYHAPGTEFRTWAPNQRRRGGGSGGGSSDRRGSGGGSTGNTTN